MNCQLVNSKLLVNSGLSDYYLALSLLKKRPKRPYCSNYRLQNLNSARIKLTIQKASEAIKLIKKGEKNGIM